MTSRSLLYPMSFALLLPAAAISCAGDSPTTPESAQLVAAPEFARMPGAPGAASGREFYMVKLEPAPGHDARGMGHIDVVGGYLRVRIHANGLEAGQHIPQHIHAGSACSPASPPVINLDAGLTLTGVEAPGTGLAFPQASEDGIINYEATRSLADLRAAWNTAFGTSLQTDAELLALLDLDDRNIHEHLPLAPTFPPVNCGPMQRVN